MSLFNDLRNSHAELLASGRLPVKNADGQSGLVRHTARSQPADLTASSKRGHAKRGPYCSWVVEDYFIIL